MTQAADPRLSFSVIVVSHKRPRWLVRCLKALRQLDHAAFEIVIVADGASLDMLSGEDFKRRVFDSANISQARNIGIEASAGDVCAFVDDDAVPEPMWLRHLEEAFSITDAGAVVGYVRGRNGISFQSRVDSVDAEGETHQQNAPDHEAFLPVLPKDHALKLVGTNAAFRRNILFEVNGFDPAYAFYLDDTDISLRLANAGIRTAVAPLAEVHHAFAPSKRRSALRAPKYLGDIGRSTAVFLRRHRGISEQELCKRLYERERARLLRHMVQGTCEPKDVGTLLQGLQKGWKDGLSCALPEWSLLQDKKAPFRRIPPISGHTVLTSRLLKRHAVLEKAAKLADSGQRVSVFSFSLTPVRHLVRYADFGGWVQTGGQFGRARRSDSVFRWCRFANRKKLEIVRVAKQRGI